MVDFAIKLISEHSYLVLIVTLNILLIFICCYKGRLQKKYPMVPEVNRIKENVFES